MADALRFFLVFTYQIWRLGKFWQKVVRRSALEFVDGGQSDAGLLRNIFLCESAAHPVILETCAINLTISGVEYSYKSAIVLSLFNYHNVDSYVAIQPIIFT